MLRLALRNLFQSKTRLIMSTGGVALALVLILALDAIMTGTERQITAYIDNSRADLFVSQQGVRNMHMASSWLPATATQAVAAVPGVEDVTPIMYVGAMLITEQERAPVYVIGVDPAAPVGIPWQLTAGNTIPPAGGVVVDHGLVEKSGLALGDSVTLLGRPFTIAGLSKGTVNLVNSIVFIPMADFARVRGNAQAVSFLLVRVQAGADPETVAQQIEAQVQGVTAQTTAAFAGQERTVVKDMSTDIVTIMNLVGFVIGLAVMALTIYTATLSRRREYGVLKAIGARNGRLYRTVLAQSFISVVLGLAAGLLLTLGLAVLVASLELSLSLQVSLASVGKVSLVAMMIAAIAAVIPVRQLGGLDPAVVFRGGSAS